ncbi:hypothetical protein Tco_0832411 [Tanacetum coccineum]
MLLLNLKKQGKESKIQAIQKEIKRKDKGEGSGTTPESPDNNSSSKDSSESTNDDKTESERELENETRALVIKLTNKEPKQQPKEFPTPSPSVTTSSPKDVNSSRKCSQCCQESIAKASSKVVSQALKKPPVNESRSVPTTIVDPTEYELKQQLYEKMFQTATYLNHLKHRALYDALADTITHDDQDDPDNREGEKKSKRRRKDDGESSSKKSKAQEVPPHLETGNDADEPRQDDEVILDIERICAFSHITVEEEPEEYEYRDGLVTQFGKLVKKIFKKDKITKADVDGPSFELLKGTCKNSIELEYNMIQVNLALTDQIDWVNPESGDRHDPAKIQNKIRNMKGMEEFDLINALRMYIRRIVIMKRVLCLKVLTPEKRLMRDNEFHKFLYGTLNKVLNKLKVIVRNKLGYRNERMEQYYWTKDDEKKTTKFIKKKINKMLKERRRFTRLELFVGGRRDKTDYRLLVRPE